MVSVSESIKSISTTAAGRARVGKEHQSAGVDSKTADEREKLIIASLPPASQVYGHISKYAKAEWAPAIWSLVWNTALVILTLFVSPSHWYMVPVFGMFRTRLFVLFHDMGHNNFFPSAAANKWVGVLAGIPLYTPYSYWTKGHNYHHKHSNNLDRPQYAQTAPWTVERFEKAPLVHRMLYSFVYGPLTLFTTSPFLYFVVFHRFVSLWYELVGQIIYTSTVFYFGGWKVLLMELMAVHWAAIFGFFLFHVQHTFTGAYKSRGQSWDYYVNGMIGSSFFNLPEFFKFFTAGIEYHHIHHLNALVPSYKIRRCHEEAGDLFKAVPNIELQEALTFTSYSVYDEPLKAFDTVFNH